MRRGYVDTSGGQLHYREAGEGPPLLLLHMTASSSVMYERSLPYLAERFHAIALDTPGFGLSDPLSEEPDIPGYAGAVRAFLDARGIERVDLVGFHTGASIGLELAVAAPARVGKLVLGPILATRDDEERRVWSEKILRPWEADGRGEFVEEILWWLPHYIRENDGDAYLTELIARLQAGPEYLLAPSAVIAYDAFAALSRLEHETLFLSPVKDNLIEETRQAFASAPEGSSRYEEIPGDDGAIYEHPAEFAAAVLEFLG
jgi:pimeloyl-ACP methyl ester carboxylesterase